MGQSLHLDFGSALVGLPRGAANDVNAPHVVGLFPDCALARSALKVAPRHAMENAHTFVFIETIPRLRGGEPRLLGA